MPGSTVSKASSKGNDRPPNLWKEAYNALREDPKGKERLQKLHTVLRKHLKKPKLHLRSEDGYKALRGLIDEKSKSLTAKPDKINRDKINKITGNMMQIQDLVAAGAGVAGPYVAVPAAALFLAFSARQIYQEEKEAMFELARKVADYTVLNAKSNELIKPRRTDDTHMQSLKESLHVVYVDFYRAMIQACAQLTIALHDEWLSLKNLVKRWDWEGQLEELEAQYQRCVQHHHTIVLWKETSQSVNRPLVQKDDPKKAMGPGPRNPLHWAVALTVPEQVANLVQKEEYPINALTPRSWTAAHLGARQGNTKIMKTLLTAPGVNLKIKNEEGRTPLHIAATFGRVGAVKLLLQRNCHLRSIRDNQGWTAFLLAAANGHVEVLKALKAEGQDMNETTSKNGWTALHLAAEKERVDAVKYLVENGTRKGAKVRDGEQKGCTAKQVAMKKGKMKVVEFL